MKNSKRILSVSIKQMVDESPDTSWLGEYSKSRTSEFSIDRAHSEDCATAQPVNESARQTLRNARAHVVDLQRLEVDTQDNPSDEWENLEESYNLLDELADEVTECDCGERGDMSRNEYRYFNPSFNYVDKNGKATDTPENVRKYVRQDYERMERLNRGDWCFMGIRAEAEYRFPYMTEGRGGRTYFNTQILTSGGLWGIESDSDAAYLESVEQEELSDLKAQLLALGFSKRAIATAFKNVERKDI